jgi:hypothetical protein
MVTAAAVCAINTSVFAAAQSVEISPVAESAQVVESQAPDTDHSANKKKKHKVDVDALVRDNVISKETGKKIKSYLKEHKKERENEIKALNKMTEEERKAYFDKKKQEGRLGIWDEMSAAGVITQEEADAIRAARKNSSPDEKCQPNAANSQDNVASPANN